MNHVSLSGQNETLTQNEIKYLTVHIFFYIVLHVLSNACSQIYTESSHVVLSFFMLHIDSSCCHRTWCSTDPWMDNVAWAWCHISEEFTTLDSRWSFTRDSQERVLAAFSCILCCRCHMVKCQVGNFLLFWSSWIFCFWNLSKCQNSL